MEYYIAIKRNKLLIPATTWVDCKDIRLRYKGNPKGYMLYYSIYKYS